MTPRTLPIKDLDLGNTFNFRYFYLFFKKYKIVAEMSVLGNKSKQSTQQPEKEHMNT